MAIREGETYILKSLKDEVVCMYVTQEDDFSYRNNKYRVAVFEFKHKVAAYHAIPITLPLAVCGDYLAEMPQMAQA